MEFFVLQNTRLHLVLNMARIIAESINSAGQSINAQRRLSQLNWSFNPEKQDTNLNQEK